MKDLALKCYLFTLSKGRKNLKKFHYLRDVFKYFRSIHWKLWKKDENSRLRAQDIINYPNREKKIASLKKGLQKADKEFISNMYRKIQLISENNILDYKKIFSEKEEKEQKDFADFCLKHPQPYFELDQISSWLNIFYQDTLLKIPNIKEYVQKKVILDCGGYIADTALMFSEKLSPQKVYTFEPNTENFNQANKTISDNNKQEIIIPIKFWVGKDNYQATISNWGAWAKINSEATGEEIEVVSIDHFINSEQKKVWLIKRDIEGLEYESIMGAEQTIKRDKPILLISIYHSWKDFFEIKPLLESWDIGYNYTFLRRNCFHPFADILLVAYPEN